MGTLSEEGKLLVLKSYKHCGGDIAAMKQQLLQTKNAVLFKQLNLTGDAWKTNGKGYKSLSNIRSNWKDDKFEERVRQYIPAAAVAGNATGTPSNVVPPTSDDRRNEVEALMTQSILRTKEHFDEEWAQLRQLLDEGFARSRQQLDEQLDQCYGQSMQRFDEGINENRELLDELWELARRPPPPGSAKMVSSSDGSSVDVDASVEPVVDEAAKPSTHKASGASFAERAAPPHLGAIPAGGLPCDVLITSPIFRGDAAPMGGDMGGAAAGGGGDNFAEYGGVDPNIDPELAMALRVSMEEERARQERASAAAAESNQAEKSGDDDAAVANNVESMEGITDGVEDDEDAQLQQALAMSMAENQAASTTEETAAAGESAAMDMGDDDDDAAMQMALAMSMQGENEEKKSVEDEPSKPSPRKALEATLAKGAAQSADKSEPIQDEPSKSSPLKASKAMFAEGAAAQSYDDSEPILREDPDYAKYFKMLKLGMPRAAVMQALERDGKDASILDLDPELPLAKQKREQTRVEESDKVSKKAALEAMLATRAAAPVGPATESDKVSKKAALEAMLAKRAAAPVGPATTQVADKPLKDHPEYQKYVKMLKNGMSVETVRQALERDGMDPDIAEMDPNKSYESQAKKDQTHQQAVEEEPKDDPTKRVSTEVPLKDIPKFAKFFKMLKMGIPIGAVRKALQKEDEDPDIAEMDPNKSLLSQQKAKPDEIVPPEEKSIQPKKAKTLVYWNGIDESELGASSVWKKRANDQSLVDIGKSKEVTNLLTKADAARKKKAKPDAKKASSKQEVIGGKRRMNGSILLAKFKVDYNVFADQVNTMECGNRDVNELRQLMQFLPTKDESLALRSHLPPTDAPRSEIEDSINKLGECERYMAAMLDVPDANAKLECMVFRAEFDSNVETIRDDTKLLAEACYAVKNSERFQKVLLYSLKLGNFLNNGGSNEGVSAITLDSLLKLAEAKAFDRETSVLHVLVSILQKNDADVLKLSEDLAPVKAIKRVAMDALSTELKKMKQGIEKLQAVVNKNMVEPDDFSSEREEDKLIEATPMGRFSLSAASKIQSLSNEFDDVKTSFADLIRFFGQDSTMSSDDFFGTINTFVTVFDRTHKELVRKEEAKARRKRIEEKQRLCKEEVAAKETKP